MLPQKGAAEPGKWRTSRTPYLREPMDCLSPHSPVQRLDMMFGAQLGKTELGLNWIGSTGHYYPCSMLMVQPTIQMAERVSKQRLDSMIRETPVLAELFSQASRDSGNTLLMKEAPGFMLILSGANSAASLASMPIMNLFGDEIDRWPGDVDEEGSPLYLAIERTNTAGARKKLLFTSTPTLKGTSAIERGFLDGDQRRYFCRCPDCKEFDYWRWENIRWESKQPETARLLCTHCGTLIEERWKTWMMAWENDAHWRPTATPKDPRRRSYHLPGLYSPLGWKSWEDLVRQFLEGQSDPSVLKTFVNTGLAETWEDAGETVDAAALLKRVETYPAEVPERVSLLVITCDTQDEWLEAAVWGFAAGDKPGDEEAWLIRTETFLGNPETSQFVWKELEELRMREFVRADGAKMRAAALAIDTQGHKTRAVYEYVRPRQRLGVFAFRGEQCLKEPVLAKVGHDAERSLPLYRISTEPLKDLLMSRLRIPWTKREDDRCPKFIHFNAEFCGEEYFKQLTSEKKQRQINKRTKKAKVVWVNNHSRNEQLDCAVYAFAMLWILQNIHPQRAVFRDLNKLHQATKGEARIHRPGVRVLSSGVEQ
jgi:phage terminase large subunit GpA-like protein